MRASLLLIAVVIYCFGCTKEKPPVVIEFTNLNDASVSYNHHLSIDLDKDGQADFNAVTQLIADTEGDHLQFRINSVSKNKILLQDDYQPKMMERDDLIVQNDQPPFIWSPIGTAMLVEHITPMDVTQSRWAGKWKEQQSKYLPVRIVKDNGTSYAGWIRISFSSTLPLHIIVHDGAVSKTPNVTVKAGQQ